MSIGGRNPTTAETGVRIAAPAGAPGYPQPGPDGSCSGCAGSVEYLYQYIPGVVSDLSTFYPGLTGPLSVFPAPPPGQRWVIERLLIATGAPTGGVSIGVGSVNPQNIVDSSELITTGALVQADGASAIVVPPGSQLWVAWFSPTTPATCAVRAQIRAEAI